MEGERDNVREEPEGEGMDENGREEGSIHPIFIANVSVLEVKMGGLQRQDVYIGSRKPVVFVVCSFCYIDSNCYFNLFEIR